MLKIFKTLLTLSIILISFTLMTTMAAAETSKTGTITGSIVNLRSKPDINSKIQDKLTKGTIVLVLSLQDDWCNVLFEGNSGWISKHYISIKEIRTFKGIISGNKVNLRTGSTINSDSLGYLYKGSEVGVMGKSGQWFKVISERGTKGWISKDYVEIDSKSSRGDSEIPTVEAESGEDASSEKGDLVIRLAKRYLGAPYVWGGSSPSGFDCSGFTSYILRQFGVRIDRTAAEQAGQGTRVKKSDLQIGDLVFFDTNGGYNHINHVGFYIGSGRFIHASNPGDDVKISDLDESYYARAYMTARRVLD
jgi:cell wall-associated NlpC family hydrolase